LLRNIDGQNNVRSEKVCPLNKSQAKTATDCNERDFSYYWWELELETNLREVSQSWKRPQFYVYFSWVNAHLA